MAGSIREIVLGYEDGSVSGLGVVTGVAAGTGSGFVVILTGTVVIVVEAFSMAAGTYLSSKSAGEVDQAARRARPDGIWHYLRAALVMWVFNLLGGLVPLSAYLFFPVRQAFVPSIVITALLLFVVGAWKTRFTKQFWLKSGAEMMVISLLAAAIGYGIGKVVSAAFGVEVAPF